MTRTMQSGFVPNGVLCNEATFVTKVLDKNRWSQVEARTIELLARIQPNYTSETHRSAVISYIQRLITSCVPCCQVFAFGSLPLKTYLPDGDIDLTTFGDNQNLQDSLIPVILNILQSEEKNEDAEFHVKEVQYIKAEVNIIKCLVENFVVDISFNQLSGLCSLCFFEEVDYLIRQNHLFKRSIILIKAWCYYESRILGSNSGLISTYALEILVLYIFHLYNNKFAGPLEVLLRFLEFFSKFDWDNYCISLSGPVPKGSLPSLRAEPPRKDCTDLLLTESFLNACKTCYGIMPCIRGNQERPFVSKHMNIMDPLCANNNLGRSISQGNFFRIKSAIALGVKRLARLMDCSEDNLIAEFDFFFKNTWDRHGNGYWIDARIYNLYIRNNKNFEKHYSTCHQCESELAQSSHGYHHGNIYQKPVFEPLKESNQMLRIGASHHASAISQTWSSKTNDKGKSSMKKNNTLANKGKSPKYPSNDQVHAMPHFDRFSPIPEFAPPIYSEVLPNEYWYNGGVSQREIGSSSRSSKSFGQASNNGCYYYNEFGLGVNNNENSHHYVMYQEEHDLMNITGTSSSRSPNFHGYNNLQSLLHVNSSDVCYPSPLPPPPPPPHGLASGQRHHADSFGAVPVTLPSFGSFPGHNMPYSQDLVLPSPGQLPWFPIMNQEEITEPFVGYHHNMDTNIGSTFANSSCKISSASHLLKDSVVTSEKRCLNRESYNIGARTKGKNVKNLATSSRSTPHETAETRQGTSLVPDTNVVVVGSGPSRQSLLSPFAFGSYETQYQFPCYNLPTETEVAYMGGAESCVCHGTVLVGDYDRYWLNLQYGRFCHNGRLQDPYPPTAVPPLYFRTQCLWYIETCSDLGNVNMAHHGGGGGPFVPEMLQENQGLTFWLPRFSGGTGTFLPNPLSYHQRYSGRRDYDRNQSENYRYERNDGYYGEREGNSNFNPRERFSCNGQFSKQGEMPGNWNFNSRERFSSHGQFNGQQVKNPGNSSFHPRERFLGHGHYYYKPADKPGTNEASHQGESPHGAVNQPANLERDSKDTSPPHQP